MSIIGVLSRSCFGASAVLAVLLAHSAWSQTSETLCASPQQASVIQKAFAKAPALRPFAAAEQLKVSEAVVLSALAPEKATGVAGSHFLAVWESLRTWQDAAFVVHRGGHIFEARGRVADGEPSAVSRFFNLQSPASGMGGRIRPDLISAIYAVDLVSKAGATRGVIFLDGQGDTVFAIYVPTEDGPSREQLTAQFAATMQTLRRMTPACGER